MAWHVREDGLPESAQIIMKFHMWSEREDGPWLL